MDIFGSPLFCLLHLVFRSIVQVTGKRVLSFGTLLGRVSEEGSTHTRGGSFAAIEHLCLCVACVFMHLHRYECVCVKVYKCTCTAPYGQTPQHGWESTCPNTMTFPRKLAGGLQK